MIQSRRADAAGPQMRRRHRSVSAFLSGGACGEGQSGMEYERKMSREWRIGRQGIATIQTLGHAGQMSNCPLFAGNKRAI
jgi:hypothetical protein